jgi:hypothetical protein
MCPSFGHLPPSYIRRQRVAEWRELHMRSTPGSDRQRVVKRLEWHTADEIDAPQDRGEVASPAGDDAIRLPGLRAFEISRLGPCPRARRVAEWPERNRYG